MQKYHQIISSVSTKVKCIVTLLGIYIYNMLQ
jgi:hypothetical protein